MINNIAKKSLVVALLAGIGFGATVHSKSEKKVSELFREVEPEDLIKFGLIPELVGACRWWPRWAS